MEARDYYEEIEELAGMENFSVQSQPLIQEYIPTQKVQKQSRKSQRRELSFFGHVASYSILFMLLYPIITAVLQFPLLSLPICLFLPIGIILGSKRIIKKYLLKK